MNWFSKPGFRESKWQQEWRNSRIFEAEPDPNKRKFYMLFAYPTTSGALHVGHARSYAIPDVIARYKRMRGFNVFFPLGFHATGIDCMNIFEAMRDDPETGVRYGIPARDAEKLESLVAVEKFLERAIGKLLQRLGLSLDFRSKISTIDPPYNRFVQWQFLHDRSKKDRFLQAASSAREVISDLLHILAPGDLVKSMDWYVPVTDNREPTQKQRALFAMLGKTGVSEEELKLVIDLAKSIRASYRRLNPIAHLRECETKPQDFSYNLIDQCQIY